MDIIISGFGRTNGQKLAKKISRMCWKSFSSEVIRQTEISFRDSMDINGLIIVDIEDENEFMPAEVISQKISSMFPRHRIFRKHSMKIITQRISKKISIGKKRGLVITTVIKPKLN